MKLIDPSVIATRLRVTLENLFQVNNHAIYLGLIHPTIAPLTLQMSNRLYFCIDEVAQIIKEIEPRKIDTGCLTLEEVLTLEGYQASGAGCFSQAVPVPVLPNETGIMVACHSMDYFTNFDTIVHCNDIFYEIEVSN